MDPTKKRKLDDNGVVPPDSDLNLTPSDARKIIERFSPEQLIDVLQEAVARHADVLDAVRSIADPDVTQRKLFIRGLGWETTTDGLRSLFSAYGELEEAIVILDKATGKSKGYGFVTFKHVDGALLALKEPSKRIDGRVTVTQLAAAGNTGSNTNAADIAMRKIYVANVPSDLPADKLLAHFSLYGEIEEGPLGFDKQTGKSKGFALFVYKTPEGAQAALVDPVKMVEGRQLNCKLAITDGKQGKRGGAGPMGPDGIQGPGNAHGDGMGLAPPSSMPGSLSGQYGGPVGMGSYGGFGSGLPGQPPLGNHPLNSSVGGTGLSSAGNQAPSSLGGTGGYSSGLGGPYGGYGGPGSTGYGALGGGGGAGLGGGSGGLAAGGIGGAGGGLGAAGSLYRLPTSVGMPTGGYQDSGPYGLSSGYPNQHHQPTGASPVPRVPPGAMYPNVPPYY
ncbi:UBP1-associated protein 2C [Neltuma alba]|uniref:UBP1-associated protein 2C n=1 Tax=Neltuma alba TaxID=207710 RepID=UPI0010A3C755|nr:UBP1-associated protein 2C [Prosopis alba]XP_028755519.1 UBP1-associated protein 2C [Prosopis alba]XP_028755520.1 UBP1-associated protein 2C [Prosopis alba]XP_028755521.1 UBP1-associated protein 2C [Prosopis alba]